MFLCHAPQHIPIPILIKTIAFESRETNSMRCVCQECHRQLVQRIHWMKLCLAGPSKVREIWCFNSSPSY